jgi:hypothetical protein
MDDNPLARDDLYVRNMAALFRVDAPLAQRIDECADDGSVTVERSRRGAPTVAVASADGQKRMHLHSRVDPEAEAKRLADGVEIG